MPLCAQRGNEDFIRGDVNTDSVLDLGDLSLLARAADANDVPCQDAADVDDDGRVLPRRLGGDPDSDYNELARWLVELETSGTRELPSPFPSRGRDTTDDDLDCGRRIGSPPGESGPEYAMDWEVPAVANPGERDIELFLLASTGDAIDGVSLAYLVHNPSITIDGVDLADTSFPAGRRGHETGERFAFDVHPTDDPEWSLLLVATVFVDENRALIDFPATRGATSRGRLLRVVATVKRGAPAGVTTVLRPFTGRYATPVGDVPGGLHPAYSSLGSSIVPPKLNIRGANLLIDVDAIIFFFRRGDCNNDQRVDISDATCTLGWLFLGADKPGCAAVTNTNGDANTDISDATYLLNFLFLGGPSLVAPFPGCGPAPLVSDDTIGCESPPTNCEF